jgi:anti-anti-sigma factor
MEFRHTTTGNSCVVSLTGKFTFTDHSIFKNIIDIIKGGQVKALTLDLSALDFIDSAALGMLLIARDESNKNGVTLTLSKPAGHIQKMFKVSKFDTLFTIVE